MSHVRHGLLIDCLFSAAYANDSIQLWWLWSVMELILGRACILNEGWSAPSAPSFFSIIIYSTRAGRTERRTSELLLIHYSWLVERQASSGRPANWIWRHPERSARSLMAIFSYKSLYICIHRSFSFLLVLAKKLFCSYEWIDRRLCFTWWMVNGLQRYSEGGTWKCTEREEREREHFVTLFNVCLSACCVRERSLSPNYLTSWAFCLFLPVIMSQVIIRRWFFFFFFTMILQWGNMMSLFKKMVQLCTLYNCYRHGLDFHT